MKNISIKDIAKLSGVGIATVSRVINNHPEVKEETREKVLDIINKYNYVPNNSARNLKRTRTNNIGVLTKGIYNPFFSKIIDAIEKIIHKEGYVMVLHNNYQYDVDDVDIAVEFVKEKRLEGLICLGGNFNNLTREKLQQIEAPLLLASLILDEELKGDYFSSVTIQNEESAFNAVNYLCNTGHNRIGIITSGEDGNVSNLRLKGYKNALKENGILFNQDFVEYGDYTFDSGVRAMKRLLNRNLNLSAVFVTSDIMAIGASKYLLLIGKKIPKDISMIGFDGIDYGAYFHPALTTVEQPSEEIGKKSAEILFDILKRDLKHKHIIIPTRLLIRESCK